MDMVSSIAAAGRQRLRRDATAGRVEHQPLIEHEVIDELVKEAVRARWAASPTAMRAKIAFDESLTRRVAMPPLDRPVGAEKRPHAELTQGAERLDPPQRKLLGRKERPSLPAASSYFAGLEHAGHRFNARADELKLLMKDV